jgi:hypothetical protein
MTTPPERKFQYQSPSRVVGIFGTRAMRAGKSKFLIFIGMLAL